MERIMKNMFPCSVKKLIKLDLSMVKYESVKSSFFRHSLLSGGYNYVRDCVDARYRSWFQAV